MFKKILIGLALLITAVMAYVAILPGDYRIARSVNIEAPVEVLFTYVNDLRKFQSWSPFAKADPSMNVVFEGPETGVGAAMAWEGDTGKSGQGRMTIVESTPNLVRMSIEFQKPFNGASIADFTITPAAAGSTIEWATSGKSSYFPRLLDLFMNMDKMMGDLYQAGLMDLKNKAETEAATIPTLPQEEIPSDITQDLTE